MNMRLLDEKRIENDPDEVRHRHKNTQKTHRNNKRVQRNVLRNIFGPNLIPPASEMRPGYLKRTREKTSQELRL